MKKLALTIVALGGIALCGASAANAADWSRNDRHQPAPHRPVYQSWNSRNDDCFVTPWKAPAQHHGLHDRFDRPFDDRFNTRFDSRFDSRYDARFDSRFDNRFDHRNDHRPTVSNRPTSGFGLALPNVNFWYAR